MNRYGTDDERIHESEVEIFGRPYDDRAPELRKVGPAPHDALYRVDVQWREDASEPWQCHEELVWARGADAVEAWARDYHVEDGCEVGSIDVSEMD